MIKPGGVTNHSPGGHSEGAGIIAAPAAIPSIKKTHKPGS